MSLSCVLAPRGGQQTGVPWDTQIKLPYGLVAPNTKPISDMDGAKYVYLIFIRTWVLRKGHE